MSDPTPAVRASDAEREQVADLVRRAVGDGRLTIVEGDERQRAAYAATFRHELTPVTADLESGAEPATPVVGKDRPDSSGSVAVMSGADRSGTWTPGLTHRAVSLMGGTNLDLRHAQLDARGLTLQIVSIMGGANVDLRGVAHDVTVQAFALMGGCEVVVDPDTVVEVTGVGFMGGFSDQAAAPTRPGGARVRVTGFAMMGGVSVTRRPLAVESTQ
ncbi:DUF1707 domain-containing protein [Actinomycetospora sp. NBRC 106378]|uniref:DUF1707 SHOCT-like domain-containing protein n=1 Tax=Actinomycetospora sp. NBRC 106378 TaxID=3032208 RepID=UPI0024A11ED8|nr:DUF1707 domain-containing protein [Actinomycetospora sp. NBRC 106378]GLZ54862.1 hypothetical protein Acsp07_44790 [Actinomycetospora sp. NBRC 106378]